MGIVTPSQTSGASRRRAMREREREQGRGRVFVPDGLGPVEKRGRESYDEEREREWEARKRVRVGGDEREMRQGWVDRTDRTERGKDHGRLSAPRELFAEGEEKMDLIDDAPRADSSTRDSTKNALSSEILPIITREAFLQRYSEIKKLSRPGGCLEHLLAKPQEAGRDYIETMTKPDKRANTQDDKQAEAKRKAKNRIGPDGIALRLRTGGVGQGRSGASNLEPGKFSGLSLGNNQSAHKGREGQDRPDHTKNQDEITISDSDDDTMEVDTFAVREEIIEDTKKDELKEMSRFMQEMIKRHPKMMERVNEPPKRKTALDMWTDMEE